jgi:hypothetical protein
LNIYIISGISNIYLTSNLELISIGYYGFSVNEIRSNPWSKSSSLKAVCFYVIISNKDLVIISDPNARSYINVITGEQNVVIDNTRKYIISI